MNTPFSTLARPSRRGALKGIAAASALGASALGGGLALPSDAAVRRVAVVGGGPAGAAAALAWARVRPQDRVLLIERDPTRLSRRGAAEAAFGAPNPGPGLAALHEAGVDVALDEAVGIDWNGGRIALFSGRDLAFDEIVLAPGTMAAAEEIDGLDAVARRLWPAAWGDAREARRLEASLLAMPAAGRVVLRLPADAGARPGIAMDRALSLATWIGENRPAARLTVLDEGARDAAGFEAALAARGLQGNADWRAGEKIRRVDARRGEIETGSGLLRADVVNFVAPQQAGRIAGLAGLTDASGWCPCGTGGRSALRPQAVILGDARKGAQRCAMAALRSAETAILGA